MVADRGKKSKIAAGNEDSDHIDPNLVISIEKLQELQEDLEKINEEANEKVMEIERKYNVVKRPVYVRRSEIIKCIPDFWLTAFLSHPAIGDLLSEDDQKIFKYLDTLDVDDIKDVKSGYSITFNFKPNPYFEDSKLTKTFTILGDGRIEITGTDIKWKEGMASANGVKHDKKGNKRPPSEESFFTWFYETQQKDATAGLPDEVADIIKDELWAHPLKYFNDEAEEDSEEDDGEDDYI